MRQLVSSTDGEFLRTPHEALTIKDIIEPVVPEQMPALVGGEMAFIRNKMRTKLNSDI